MSIENDEKRPSFNKLYEIIHVLNIDANLIFYPERVELEDDPTGRLIRLLSLCSDCEITTITALVETYLSCRGKGETSR